VTLEHETWDLTDAEVEGLFGAPDTPTKRCPECDTALAPTRARSGDLGLWCPECRMPLDWVLDPPGGEAE
jgi:hypothetical protein